MNFVLIKLCVLRTYDEMTRNKQVSTNISKGRILDVEFDNHLFRLVILFRVKEVKVTNLHIKLLTKKLLTLPKYKYSSSHKLKFSNQWLWRWKRHHHIVYRRSAKSHLTKAKTEDIDS